MTLEWTDLFGKNMNEKSIVRRDHRHCENFHLVLMDINHTYVTNPSNRKYSEKYETFRIFFSLDADFF